MRVCCLLVLLTLILNVRGQEQYTIKGKIEGIREGACVELMCWNGNAGERVGVDTVRNGKFFFSGMTEGLSRMSINIAGDTSFYGERTLWVRAEKIRVNGRGQCVALWKVESNLGKQIEENNWVKQTGSYLAAWEKLYHEKGKEYEAERKDRALKQPVMGSYPVSRELDSLYLLKSAKILELLEQQGVLTEVGMEQLYPMAREIRYSSHPRFDKNRIGKVFSQLDPGLKNSARAIEIHSYLYPVKLVQLGDQMADGVLFDLQGNKHQLSDYRGNYILLDFWHSACTPCREAHPELNEVALKYRDSLTVVSICLNTTKEWWKKSSEKLACVNLSDLKGDGGLVAYYGTDGVPLFIIIDREGKVADKWYGYGKGVIKGRLAKYWREKWQ